VKVIVFRNTQKGGYKMLTNQKNVEAEMLYKMSLKLLTSEQVANEGFLDSLWAKCYADKKAQHQVSLYLCASFDSAPRVLHKLHQTVMELVR
jgi:hypothetical protein